MSAQLCVETVTSTALPAAINPYGCRFHVAQSFLRICASVPPVRKMRRSMFFSAPLMATDRTPLVRALMPHDRTTLGARGSDLEARVARVESAVADVKVVR